MAQPFQIFLEQALRRLSPETAHSLALTALKSGLFKRVDPAPPPALAQSLWGLDFPHPLGLAAGFDKNAEAIPGLFKLGFSFVEAGTITPQAQAGNPKPRLFRLPVDTALINRMGFNNKGMRSAAAHLAAVREAAKQGQAIGPIGINIGKNRESIDAVRDYVTAARHLVSYADYITLNVSSPNTPGLRDLQAKSALSALITSVQDITAHEGAEKPCPLLVKISPDMSDSELDALVTACQAHSVDGIIIANTTLSRPPSLQDVHRFEPGGLSGAPLFDLSTRVLAKVYHRTGKSIPLIGVGGIVSPAQAYQKICAGASLLQVYTGFVYKGSDLIADCISGLARHLEEDAHDTIQDAVGSRNQDFL